MSTWVHKDGLFVSADAFFADLDVMTIPYRVALQANVGRFFRHQFAFFAADFTGSHLVQTEVDGSGLLAVCEVSDPVF